MPDVSSQHSTPDALRGNVEAGLRLLLKSEKPLYRRAAEVAMEDLQRLSEQYEDLQRVLERDRKWGRDMCARAEDAEEQLEAAQQFGHDMNSSKTTSRTASNCSSRASTEVEARRVSESNQHSIPGPPARPTCDYCGDDFQNLMRGYKSGCPKHDPALAKEREDFDSSQAMIRLTAYAARLEEQIESLKSEVDGMARAPYGEYQKMRERAERAEEQLEVVERERDWWRERYMLDEKPDADQVARLDYEAAEFAASSPAREPDA